MSGRPRSRRPGLATGGERRSFAIYHFDGPFFPDPRRERVLSTVHVS